MSPTFCEDILGHFPEESVIRGVSLSALSFVSCTDIKDSFLRGLRTWSTNHKHVTFTDISNTAPCAQPTSSLADSCPWELYVGTEASSAFGNLAAYVINHRWSTADAEWYNRDVRAPSGVTVRGVDAHWRSVMRFQTNICWYLDATFCYLFHRWEEDGIDVLLTTRSVLFSICALALALALRILLKLLFLSLQPCADRSPRRHSRLGAALDYLSSLPPLSTILIIFFCVSPPVFYERIFLPCWECFDFEAAVAHEVGHVLGFGHPDSAPDDNLVAACRIDNSTCRAPFECAAAKTYDKADASIMHSFTTRQPQTCLSSADLQGLHFLYPICDDLLPQEVACTKSQRLSGYLRLVLVVGVPFVAAVLLILLPLSCLRCRERRKLRELNLDLTSAIADLSQAKQQLSAATLREAVHRGMRSPHGGTPSSTRNLMRQLTGSRDRVRRKPTLRLQVVPATELPEPGGASGVGTGIDDQADRRSRSSKQADVPATDEKARPRAKRLASYKQDDLSVEEIAEDEKLQESTDEEQAWEMRQRQRQLAKNRQG